ncbi:hypothetical protein EH223_00265 [candidate division KSB1 bacterium]|nr:hypothetical protein [candidate division KSB1 bacterium]RQW07354.1 MAG: hypothetical protein EH223_00265 [candidate division KSB1 bacterium]
MQIKFNTLCAVEILNEYYSSGFSRDFLILPTFQCRRQLRNYGLIFKQTEGGFKIFYEVATGGAANEPKKPLIDPLKFSFLLIPQTPYLLNYSDLPLDTKPKDLFVFNNLYDNEYSNADENVLFLSNKNRENSSHTKIYASEDDRLPVRSQAFQYSFETDKESILLEVVDRLGRVIIQNKVVVNEGLLSYFIDLHSVPPDQYIIKLDGSVEEAFYASDEIIRQNCFGIIDIYANEAVPENYRFVDETGFVLPDDAGEKPYRTFIVRIKNRQTIWMYIVGVKFKKDIDTSKLAIDSFTQLDEIVMPDNSKRVRFVSDAPKPLQEGVEKQIALKYLIENGNNNGNGNGSTTNVLIGHLPNPSIAVLKPDGDNIYSEIFVYI